MSRPDYILALERQHGVPSEMHRLFDGDLQFVDYAIDHVPKEHQQLVRETPISLLRTSDINAHCGKAPNGQPFVVVEAGLVVFLEIFNCLFLQHMMEAISREAIVPASRAQILLDAAATLVHGELGHLNDIEEKVHAELAAQRPRSSMFRDKLLQGEISSVLGHEYGHLVLGHLGTLGHLSTLSVSPSIEIRLRAQDDEFEADEYGFHFATSWVSEDTLPAGVPANWSDREHDVFLSAAFQLAGPHVFASLLRLTEYCHQFVGHETAKLWGFGVSESLGKEVLEHFRDARSSHPAARLRAERIWDMTSRHPSVRSITQNAQVVVEQTMRMLYEGRIRMHNLRELAEARGEQIPDSMLLKYWPDG